MSLPSLSREQLMEVAEVLGAESLSEEERAQKIRDRVGDESLFQRVVDWLPEAFGWALVANVEGVVLPNTFHVKDDKGNWVELQMSREPLFATGVELAKIVARSPSCRLFEKLALSSSMVAAVNDALNSGRKLDGAVISGPAFVRLRAELYPDYGSV